MTLIAHLAQSILGLEVLLRRRKDNMNIADECTRLRQMARCALIMANASNEKQAVHA